MNIIEEQNRIRGYSDDMLEDGLRRPAGDAPFTQFLGAIEMTRRGRQRKAAGQAAAAQRVRGSTVVNDLINASQSIGQPQPPQQALARGLRHGGLVQGAGQGHANAVEDAYWIRLAKMYGEGLPVAKFDNGGQVTGYGHGGPVGSRHISTGDRILLEIERRRKLRDLRRKRLERGVDVGGLEPGAGPIEVDPLALDRLPNQRIGERESSLERMSKFKEEFPGVVPSMGFMESLSAGNGRDGPVSVDPMALERNPEMDARLLQMLRPAGPRQIGDGQFNPAPASVSTPDRVMNDLVDQRGELSELGAAIQTRRIEPTEEIKPEVLTREQAEDPTLDQLPLGQSSVDRFTEVESRLQARMDALMSGLDEQEAIDNAKSKKTSRLSRARQLALAADSFATNPSFIGGLSGAAVAISGVSMDDAERLEDAEHRMQARRDRFELASLGVESDLTLAQIRTGSNEDIAGVRSRTDLQKALATAVRAGVKSRQDVVLHVSSQMAKTDSQFVSSEKYNELSEDKSEEGIKKMQEYRAAVMKEQVDIIWDQITGVSNVPTGDEATQSVLGSRRAGLR